MVVDNLGGELPVEDEAAPRDQSGADRMWMHGYVTNPRSTFCTTAQKLKDSLSQEQCQY
jgi:hypothetical protein